MRLVVEGWRFIPHSFALLNLYFLRELLRRPGIELYHRDVTYFHPQWQPLQGLLGADQESALRTIPAPGPGLAPDVTLRVFVPADFTPTPTGRTFVWGATEYLLVQNELMQRMGIKSLAQVHASTDVVIITPSRWSREGFLRSGADPARVVVVPLGIDPEVYRPLPEAERAALRAAWKGEDIFLFLHIGVMSRNKGTQPLLKAFAVIAERYPHARLLLKGCDHLYVSKDQLRGVAQETLTAAEIARVEPRITYLGQPLSAVHMAQLYQAADAYVSPYLAEGFNLPVLEAAACGVPVLCTRGGPTDDFTDPAFALSIDSRLTPVEMNGETRHVLIPDVDHLIALMEEVIRRPELAARARAEGPRHVRAQYTWERVTDELLRVLSA
jgi:glycosyltransferase involved in cell wall biosynthesis